MNDAKQYREQLLAMLGRWKTNYMDDLERIAEELIEVVENFTPVIDKDFRMGERHWKIIQQGVRVKTHPRSKRTYNIYHAPTDRMLSAVNYTNLGSAMNAAEKMIEQGRHKIEDDSE